MKNPPYHALLALITLCFTSPSPAEQLGLEHRLLGIVGETAVNCGVYHLKNKAANYYLSDPEAAKVSQCLADAYQNGRAFYVAVGGSGIGSGDYYVAKGLLGLPNASGVYHFGYNSSPSNGEPIGEDRFGMSLCHTFPGALDPEKDCRMQLKAPPPVSAELKGKNRCEFANLKLSDDVVVWTAEPDSGRELEFQIDQKSGHQTRQVEILANQTNKPLALILGNYEPTIWNIHWTQGTDIIAVVVGGYYRQAVAGLPPGVPILNSTEKNVGRCDDFYGGSDIKTLNPLSRRLFDRPVEKVYVAKNGTVLLGDEVAPDMKILSSPATPPDSFFDRDAPRAGRAGLEDGVKKGLLRKATKEDAIAWFTELPKPKPKDVPSIAGQAPPTLPEIYRGAYVVLKPFVFPVGLFGGDAARFFVPRGVPRPSGNPGHSAIYDFNTLKCTGSVCDSGVILITSP
jgi:hypothetical protein